MTTSRSGPPVSTRLRGPGTVNLDASLFRDFSVTERIKTAVPLQYFQHDQYASFQQPVRQRLEHVAQRRRQYPEPGGYTTITSTKGTGRDGLDQRVLQFGMHLKF